MKRSMFIAIAALGAMLAGCDGAVEKMTELFPTEPMTLVIPPGYEIAIDGKPVKVFGHSLCPKEDASMRFLFGPSSLDGSSDCLVINPTDKTVQARIALDGKLADETWAVERDKNRVGLRRPGGLPVISYDALNKGKDMRGQTLALNATGCVAKGPDGKPLQLPVHPESGQVLIPKGSTFTPECFHDEGKKQ